MLFNISLTQTYNTCTVLTVLLLCLCIIPRPLNQERYIHIKVTYIFKTYDLYFNLSTHEATSITITSTWYEYAWFCGCV